MEKRGDKGGTKLGRADKAGRRGGAGCRASGGAKTRVARAAPPEKGVRTEGAGRLPAGAGARRRDDAVTPGPSANTHSLGRRGPGRSTREASAAPTGGEDRGSGRGEGSSSPSHPATSLRPVTALGRSRAGPSSGAPTTPRRKVPLLPVTVPRAPLWPRGQSPGCRQSLGVPHARTLKAPARVRPPAARGPTPAARTPQPAAARAAATPERSLQLCVPGSRGRDRSSQLLATEDIPGNKCDLMKRRKKGQSSLGRDM